MRSSAIYTQHACRKARGTERKRKEKWVERKKEGRGAARGIGRQKRRDW